MHLQNWQTYYAKYKKEESEIKALMELIKEEGMAVTVIERKKNVNIRSVTLEYCFRGEETQEKNNQKKENTKVKPLFL